MKTAIIHDWLVTYAGAERVLEQIVDLYPDADLYSLIDFLPPGGRSFIRNKPVETSFLQRIPFAKKMYRGFLPLMPAAIEQFDLSAYDLILSSSYAVAKGVLTHAGQLHICYCHSPMRYAWDLQHQYLRESRLDKGLRGILAKYLLARLRSWDVRSSPRVSHFIANSRYIADRIKRCYARNATVIYPPVDVESFTPGAVKEPFYLTASRMVPYKKIDLIVEAFGRMPEKMLIVIGDGPDLSKIRKKAGGNVQLLGFQPASILKDYLQRAEAFVFAAEEDFGIVTVEAQACGTPVIAFGRGGSRETVVDGKTGLFFEEQTVDSILDAVHRFEALRKNFDANVLRNNAERFGRSRFRHEFRAFVDQAVLQRWC